MIIHRLILKSKHTMKKLISPALKKMQDNHYIICKKTIDSSGNEIIYYRHFTCPDPERFCRTMKLSSMYFDKDPLDPNTKVLEGEPQEKPEWNFDYSDLYNETETENNTEPTKHPTQNNNKLRSIYIALIVIGSLAINVIICTVVFVVFRKKSNDADSDRNLIFLNEINPNDK
ncbi:hypothetical protein TVAG_271750 [Trichomonas vaginalis G3]|uniref:Uncharacterized protein n=1 Tax=Trichomonas vaginalis (strain ATCC PRA-98 / G3) TaxID=412133 RepID=A2E5S2_TRIV3|nr:regulation of choline O-acetyltransferase protein [Trichomonas vaginalis G3]EAY11992.1 hypothetical protein TVAG_271750 [Trichomonas vaginalis G3]KAI5524833.1 regulation of choline O-acetyltransferase protein [Trichomonas vaginalis G3]|eukprot:XP_001324215.1 hypothetical protein [Trichomonas vaginalis G3]